MKQKRRLSQLYPLNHKTYTTEKCKMSKVSKFYFLPFFLVVLLLNSRFEKEIDNVYDRGGRMDLGNMLNQESPTFRYIFLFFENI
jgi:hypothetical protein